MWMSIDMTGTNTVDRPEQKYPNGSTAERILDTAQALYLGGQAEKISMDALAKAAGMGRATLYRHFQNRDELVLSLMVREARALAANVQQQLQGIDEPCEHIIEGIILAVDAVSSSELFAAVFVMGGMDRGVLMSDRLLAVGMEIIVPLVGGAGLAKGTDLEALTEWIYRMLISFITVPSAHTASPAAMRKLLHKMLLPLLR